MPDLKCWLSSSPASESNSQERKGEDRHPEDEKQSHFCESLLGLMQRTGRFDYLDHSTDGPEKEEEGIQVTEKEQEKDQNLRRSLNRFSWSR